MGCLFGAIATEFGEIKQFYGKAAEIKLKLINFRSKRETEENSIKESIFAKRVRKQFELSKTKLLRKGLPI